MIIVRSPYRCSLWGGGSDYPDFINENEYGIVISFAIDKYCYIAIKKLLPFHKYKTKITYDKRERVYSNNKYITHPIFRHCIEFAELQDESLEINHISDVVGGCGLATSSTMVVTLLEALRYYSGDIKSEDEYTLFKKSAYVEQELMKEPAGFQDYLPAIYGNSHRYDITNNGNKIYPLRNKFNYIINKYGLLFYTGISRKSSVVINKYIDYIAISSEQLQIRDLAERAYEEIMDQCRWEVLANILNVGWELKKKISPEICTAEVQQKIDYLYNAGATGLKLLGGGGGGSVFVLAPPDRHYNILEEASKAGLINIPFRIAEQGVERIL